MSAITLTIPFYANQAYLRRTIDSVLRQSVADFRLIVRDDCGPEPEAEGLVKSYNDSRITYIRNERNLGLAGNWNACLEDASTDLVTILHADDELEPHYIATMLTAARTWPEATAFFCRARIIDAYGAPVFSFPDFVKRFLIPATDRPVVLKGEDGLRRIMRGNFIMCPTLCYRRSRLGDLRFSSRWKMVLDLEMIAELLQRDATLVGLPSVAYRYRRHAENQTSKLTGSLVRFEEESAIYSEIATRAQERGWTSVATVSRRKTIIKLNLLYCIVSDLLKRRLPAARMKAGMLRRLLAARS